MSTLLQNLLVGGLIVLAITFVAWKLWRTLAPKNEGGCGCGSSGCHSPKPGGNEVVKH